LLVGLLVARGGRSVAVVRAWELVRDGFTAAIVGRGRSLRRVVFGACGVDDGGAATEVGNENKLGCGPAVIPAVT